jgi:hypothetical protein
MKNTIKLIKDLAHLYGIQVEDSSVLSNHVVIRKDGVEQPLTLTDYTEVFGIQSINTLRDTLATFEPVRTWEEKFFLRKYPEVNFKQNVKSVNITNIEEDNVLSFAA